MNEVLKNINVDLSRSGNPRLIFARQNDRDSRKIRIKLLDGGENYPVNEESVATLNVLRPDGDSFAVAAEVTDGVVEVTIPYRALAVAGRVSCSVSIYSEGDKKLTSDDFTLDVKEAQYKGDDIAEDDDVTLLISLISKISEIKLDEKNRVIAEQGRESAEAERVAAEEERKAAEVTRAQNDLQFDRNESARFSAETERISAEEARETAESLRREGEAARVLAEEEREKSEAARILAEEERARADEARNDLIEKLGRADGVSLLDEDGRFESESVEGALGELDEKISTVEIKLYESIGFGGKLTLMPGAFDEDMKASVTISEARGSDLLSFYPESAADLEAVIEAGIFILPDAPLGEVSFTAKKNLQKSINFRYFVTKGEERNV